MPGAVAGLAQLARRTGRAAADGYRRSLGYFTAAAAAVVAKVRLAEPVGAEPVGILA